MTDARRLGALSAVLSFAVVACGSTAPSQPTGASMRADNGLVLPGQDMTPPGNGGELATAAGGGRPGPDSTSGEWLPSSGREASGGGIDTGAGENKTGRGIAPGRNTGAVTIGVLGTSSAQKAATSAGVNLGNSLDTGDIQKALVEALNSKGGLDGRRINAIYYNVDLESADYSSQFQAACAKFTQDHRVAAVLSSVSILSDAFEDCIKRAGVPHIETSWATVSSRQLKTAWPSLIVPNSPSSERREAAKIRVLAATGWVSKANKLGVIVEECPQNLRGYSDGTVPAARSVGVPIVSVQRLSCQNGFGDVGRTGAALQNALLQFRSQGVDRVLFVSNQEAQMLLLFAQSADSQQFYPGYVLSSAAGAAAIAPNLSQAQRENIRLAGWLPTLDTDRGHRPPLSGAYGRCVSLLSRRGINPASPADDTFLGFVCDSFFLYARALQVTGGDTSAQAVLKALPRIGTTYDSAANLTGRSDFSVRSDGVDTARPAAYDTGCSCFRYAGALQRI